MEEVVVPIVVCGMLFIGVPWLILHYVTQWRRARGLSVEDENLLDELHDLARRLEDRLQTIERIVEADDPGAMRERRDRAMPTEGRWPGRA